MATHVHPDPAVAHASAERLGGTEGNEVLTAATAAVLTVLLLAEGVTILLLGSLRTAHMFIGMVLIPPVLVKLASTGYRFVRYYARAPRYRRKGPPALIPRVLAPVLVFATIGVFATGVALLAAGHRSDLVMTLHKASFIVWGAVFGVHFLWHLPGMLRAAGADVAGRRRDRPRGAGLRVTLVTAALGGGVALAIALLPAMTSFHGERGGDEGAAATVALVR